MNHNLPRSDDYHEGFAIGFDKAIRKVLELINLRAEVFRKDKNYHAMEAIERAMQDIKERFEWTI